MIDRTIHSILTMCGIVGYLGKTSCVDFILCGLKLLQNRGYDSVGLGTIQDGALYTIKYASTAEQNALVTLENQVKTSAKSIASTIAIGHTRWATHGGKTHANAHPHHDQGDRVSIVHNGIIENFHEIKGRLVQDGYTFRSQTDTEVIAVLLGSFLDKGASMDQAIDKVLTQLSGTWALVILHRDFPDTMWVCRNGSPLLVGMDEDFVMVVSEPIAFANFIQKYVILDNHDVVKIQKTPERIQYSQNIHRYAMTKRVVTDTVEYVPTNYAHWMMKEIAEQPEAVQRAINHGGRIASASTVKLGGLDTNRERLLQFDHLILLGCGTSYHAGQWSLSLFKSLDCFETVAIYDGAEFVAGDIPKRGITGLIFLSQSGETKDLHRCIQLAKERDLSTIGIVNVPDSLLARETDCGVYLNAGREVAVASTKSFTNQCVVLALVAVWFSQNRGTCPLRRQKIIQDLRNVSAQIQTVLDKRDEVRAMVSSLAKATSMFLLGKGAEEAVAKEGALKVKEVAYIHAEGYSTSSLKHGPFALLVQDVPVILLDVGQVHRDKTRNAYQEVAARDARILCITDDLEVENDHYGSGPGSKTEPSSGLRLILPNNTTFSGIVANVYVQMLSYELAVHMGHNPDCPRNLAKVVTVE